MHSNASTSSKKPIPSIAYALCTKRSSVIPQVLVALYVALLPKFVGPPSVSWTNSTKAKNQLPQSSHLPLKRKPANARRRHIPVTPDTPPPKNVLLRAAPPP